MKPEFSEIRNLEQMAANQVPSIEGAWWIMLQTACSIYNTAVIRDPVNNAVMDEFWHDISEKVTCILNKGGIRPLPYDDLMVIIDYCGDQLHTVLKNPRNSIVKVDNMVLFYRVRNIDKKTMNWLGKQPGNTIKEKLSGKNKMLTKVNKYLYDIKENQIALVLYKQIMKRVKERVNYGIAVGGYDENSTSASIMQMKKLKRELRNSELLEVKPVNHTQANNVLLADKNYSVIWKAYLDMSKYDKKIIAKWNNAIGLFIDAIFIAINSILECSSDVQTVEERINLSSKMVSHVTHVVGYKEDVPLVVKVHRFDNNIKLDILYSGLNGRNSLLIDSYIFNFDDSIGEKKLLEKRGYPIEICINSKKEKQELLIYADMKGVNQLVHWCTFHIESLLGKVLHYENEDIEPIMGTCIFDIISDGAYFSINNEEKKQFYCDKAVTYIDLNNDVVDFKGNKKNLYPDSLKIIRISDAVNKELQTEALQYALEDISKAVQLDRNDFFIYTVPDALEEFSQRNLKQCMNAKFTRTFPIWRSVAAISGIITDKSNNIKSDDIFISIDLMGETATAGLLTVKYEPKIGTFVCNHYPPFPQSEEGDFITEKSFFRNYLMKYLKIKNNSEKEKIISKIIEAGIIEDVLWNCVCRNYSLYENGRVRTIHVDFDDKILQECISEWIMRFKQFWRKIDYRLPKGVQYATMLSDSVMQHVNLENISDIIGYDNQYKATLIRDSKNISEGAYIYIDRLRNKFPTWTEYLPELSLEVIKDGKYAQLELISNNVSFDVMGETNELVVSEKLVLKAGEKEFRFPLIKKDISRTSSMIEAYITNKSFPLKNDVIVELSIKYKYGYDNSYELTLKPFDPEEEAFKEIIVEWANVVRDTSTINIWPPKTQLMTDDIILKAIDDVKESLIRIEYSIKKHMVNYEGVQDKSYPIKQTDRFLNNNIFKLRNIVISDIEESKEFINWLLGTDLYKYLGQISGLFKSVDIPTDFYRDNKGKELDFFRGDCMQAMFSIGVYTPEVIQKHFTECYDIFGEKYRMKAMIDMLLKNGNNQYSIKVIMKEVRNASDRKSFNVKMDGLVKQLSKMCCFDSDLIYAFYKADSKFIVEMTNYIIRSLEKQLSICKKFGDNFRLNKATKKRYMAYLEGILAILRLRDPDKVDDFKLLLVNSDESRKLANDIKILDEYMQHPVSKVRFKLDKPESLSKMSDLSYALDLYLTGDKKAAFIEVIGIDEDD